MLYPLKFKPVFKEKIWGGQKIRTKLNIDFSPLPNCGEMWALSGVSGYQTKIANGFLAGNDLNEIVEIYMDELVGEKVFEKHKTEFPLLVKIIDATDYLSIQVHPDDQLARKRNLGNGKTEMWYILDAGPDSELISGFNREMDASTYLRYLQDKKLKEILNVEPVGRDDLFFIPSGRVHALGPGILLAEIQQTSDTTYRIYDWDRTDASGNPRELHTELALEAIDFQKYDSYRTHYHPLLNKTSPLIDCPYFTTNLLAFDLSMEKDYSDLDSFVVYLGLEGNVSIKSGNNRVLINPGEVVLLPATIENAILEPSTTGKLLEVYIS